MKNVIHQYYRKKVETDLILIQINPHTLEGVEILVSGSKYLKKTQRHFDADIYDDLDVDGFEPSNALEFNVYLSELV